MGMTLPEELLRCFQEDDLPLPPLPADLADALEEIDDFLYMATTAPEKSLCLGFTGHGLQSWRFRYQLRLPGLVFELDLPYARALSDRDMEKEELAGGSILAHLCLAAVETGLTRPGWDTADLEVTYNERLCFFRCLNPAKETLCEGEGLPALLDLLETSGKTERPQDWLPV